MPIGQHTRLEELFGASELDELKAARFHNFAVTAFAGLGSTGKLQLALAHERNKGMTATDLSAVS